MSEKIQNKTRFLFLFFAFPSILLALISPFIHFLPFILGLCCQSRSLTMKEQTILSTATFQDSKVFPGQLRHIVSPAWASLYPVEKTQDRGKPMSENLFFWSLSTAFDHECKNRDRPLNRELCLVAQFLLESYQLTQLERTPAA